MCSKGYPGLEIQWLHGLQGFEKVWAKMRQYTLARNQLSADCIWLLQHEPVYTLGQAGRADHIINPGHIPVVHTDRGGQVTYHGPGQLIAYCLIDLRRHGFYVKSYVAQLEQVIMDTLAYFGADYACLKPGAPGVYVPVNQVVQPIMQTNSLKEQTHSMVEKDHEVNNETLDTTGQLRDDVNIREKQRLAKIAALGVKITKGCAYHGIAINVDMDLSPFAGINPCGYAGLLTTDLAHCGIHTTVSRVGQQLAKQLEQVFSN